MNMLLQSTSIIILRLYICRVVASRDLLEFEILLSDSILDPQVGSCQVSTFPSPLLQAIRIAAVASVMIVISSRMPKSAARDCKPKDCAAPLHIPVNSASADDKATVD